MQTDFYLARNQLINGGIRKKVGVSVLEAA